MKKAFLNPFIDNDSNQLEVLSIINSQSSGDDFYSKETTSKYIKEKQGKVSIYRVMNNEVYTEFLFSLNRPARDIFLYIIANLGENKDYIKLDPEIVCRKTGLSRNYYYSGLKSLKDNQVIINKKRAEFWINPYYLFRGDRVEYYKSRVPDKIKIAAKIYY